jgi:dTDP-4-dehydrorhamnose 3,5-epimerase
MIFTETRLKGAYSVDIERREDQRGFFARGWCAEEFEAHDLNFEPAYGSVEYRLQHQERHPARHALPGTARSRG